MTSPHNNEGLTSSNLPPSDPEPSDISSDEFPETQLMSVSIIFKEGGQIKSSSYNNSGDTSRQDILGGPVALLSTVPPTLAATTQREFAGELDISSPNKSSAKKISCLISKKKADRSSHMPRATPREKELQEKKSPTGCVSKVVLGRKSQAYISGGPLAPATFPPISGRPEIGIAEKCSLVPSGTKQSKHNCRKNPVLSRMRKSERVDLEDTKPNKVPAPKGQLPAYRPGPFCLSTYVGRYSSGDPKIKSFPAPGHSPLLTMAQERVRLSEPSPTGDQGPLLHPSQHEKQQPPPGAQDCPQVMLSSLGSRVYVQCAVLQREIDSLKSQLVAMQCFIDKFQAP